MQVFFAIVGVALLFALAVLAVIVVGSLATMTAGAIALGVGIKALYSTSIHTTSLVKKGHQEAVSRPVTDRTFDIFNRLYEPQPARMLYPLDGGWYVVIHLSQNLWGFVKVDAEEWFERARIWWDKGRKQPSDDIPNIVAFFSFAVGAFLGACLYYMVAVMLWALFSIFFILVMVVWTSILLILMAFLALITWLYGWHYKLFNRCPKCHNQMRIPIYECPGCGAEHSQLLPSAYGVLKHTCECGEKLSTIHFWGRKNYKQICPSCNEVMHGNGTTIHITVFGGPSAGKSHLITSAVKRFIDEYAEKSIDVTFPDDEQKKDFDARVELLDRNASLPKTSVDYKNTVYGYNLEIKYPKRLEPGLLYIYDMMGEHAGRPDDAIEQAFLRFSESGIILVLDPFSFPQVQTQYKDEDDFASLRPSKEPPSLIVNNLVNALEVRRKSSVTQKHKTPLAVVITKADGFDIQDKISMSNNALPPELVKSSEGKNSQNVQSFLFSLDPNLVQLIHSKFGVVRYFSISSMKEMGDSDAVVAPLGWILDSFKIG